MTDLHNELAALHSWNIRDENDPPLSPKDNIWSSLDISPTAKCLLDGSLAYRNDAIMNGGRTVKSHGKSLMPRCRQSLDAES